MPFRSLRKVDAAEVIGNRGDGQFTQNEILSNFDLVSARPGAQSCRNAILLVSEVQRQHGWFACLKTLPTYESRAARERISPCSVFKIQI
jgi:hypothetical protein